MKTKCIYTFIIGEYDNLKDPNIITDGWDYICVTDNPNLKSDIWKIIQIKDEDKNIQPLKKRAMSLMIGYQKYLPCHYDIVITIGGQMVINIDLDQFLEKYEWDLRHDAGFLLHPNRNCVYEEGKAVVQVKRDIHENIETHLAKYQKEGYPKNNGLYATGVMILNNKSEKLKELFRFWLIEYQSSPSVRDQMSLNYSIWKLDNELNIKELSFIQMIELDKDIYTQPHQKTISHAMTNTTIINLENKINQLYRTPSDINEHVPIMLKYGQECDHITEMGVRWVVSTWVWLGCAPKKFISYDLFDPSHWGADINPVKETAIAYGLDYKFKQEDVLKIEIEETDLLFIDTWHSYDQLKAELKLHADRVRKYICFHDTTSYEFKDEPLHHENSWGKETSGKGIWPAIEEFLNENKESWRLKERFMNNNGFTIIERI